MAYVESNLLKGERVRARAHVHWWAWGKGLILALIGIFVVSYAPFLSTLLIMVGGYLIVRGLIVVMTTELVVTDRRVIAKFGLIRRSTIELLHHKVEGMAIDQSVFGRLLGFGTIVVNGTGSSKTPIPHITRPLDFRREALEVIEAPAK